MKTRLIVYFSLVSISILFSMEYFAIENIIDGHGETIVPCQIQRGTEDAQLNNRVPIIDPCNPGGGGPTGPTRAPSKPSKITNQAYSLGDYTVAWNTSNGYGYSVKYKLYEQKNNGRWVAIYHGFKRNKVIRNQSSGNYKYRVQGCNRKGCSSYRTGYLMKVENSPLVDYEALYPGLSESRVDDASFVNANTKFHDVTHGVRENESASSTQRSLATARMAGVGDGDGFNLAKGYSLTLDDYAPETACLDTNDLYITETPIEVSGLEFNQVVDSEDLYQKLDLDTSPNLSFALGPLSVGVDKFKLFRETTTKRKNQNLLIKWYKQGKRLDLATTSALKLKPYWVNNYFNPADGNDNSETHFRNLCGDKFVQSVSVGARLYVVATINDEEISNSEMIHVSAQAKLKLGKVLSLDASGTLDTETREFFDKHSITMNVLTEGGSTVSVSLRSIDLLQLRGFVDDFIADVQQGGYVALDKTLSDYPAPAIYNNLQYFDVFKDYRPFRKQLERWINIDHQANARCSELVNIDEQIDFDKYANQCHTSRFYLGPNVTNCANGNQWGVCAHPLNAFTDRGTALIGWLDSNVPSLHAANSVVNKQSLIPYFKVKKGRLERPRTATRTASVCLPHNECLVRKGRQHTDQNNVPGNIAPPGVSVFVSDHSTHGGNGVQRISPYQDGSGAQCLSTSITIKTPRKRVGRTYAWYKGSQILHGRCPVSDSFYVIP